MNAEQSRQMEQISENVIECWTRIKAKARARGDITNIEKYAPCITKALNNMEEFLAEIKK
jgi:hypothetical protein